MRLPRLLLRRISTQLYLLTLVAAVVVPLLAFGAFLLTRYAATERARFERDASQIARQVALVLDAELAGLAALLKGLSVSSALERGDWPSSTSKPDDWSTDGTSWSSCGIWTPLSC